MHNFHIYHDINQANEVVDRLLAAGIGRKHISILTSEAAGARQLALTEGSKAAEGGGIGASIGGAVGLIAGTLITAATAGVGVLATGPLFAGLAGMGAGGMAGGLAGTLIGAGIPEAEAKFYAREIKDKDAILIGVETVQSDRDTVREIMMRGRPTLGIRSDA